MFFSVVVPSCVSPVARATTPSLPSLNVNFAQVGYDFGITIVIASFFT